MKDETLIFISVGAVVLIMLSAMIAQDIHFNRDCLKSHKERKWVGKSMGDVRVCDYWDNKTNPDWHNYACTHQLEHCSN